MLSIRGAGKSFGGIKVLEGVDVDISPGTVHALLGANGAGKSTLINILGGRFSDAQGMITLNGRALKLDNPVAALSSGIGIVHQEFDLVPSLTVAENLFLGRESLGNRPRLLSAMRRRELQSAARSLLNEYELNLNPADVIESMPVAARQLTQIARALSQKSEVVIFDEPTARLGHAERELLFSIFSRLKLAGKMIIFVTHYLDEVMQVADKATVMRDGRVVANVEIKSTSVRELSLWMVGDGVVSPRRQTTGGIGRALISVKHYSGSGFGELEFSLQSGEIVGVLGHPGSGRHEFTRDIVGNLRKGRLGSHRSVGFLPENRRAEGVFPQLSVGENMSLGMLIHRSMFGIRDKRAEREAEIDLIEKLGIRTTGPTQKISNLSGGNQQKAVFGRAIIQAPDIYVIECPTVGVDVRAAADIHTQIIRLAENGTGILLATDDLDEVLQLADRIVVMFRGKIVAEFSLGSATKQSLIAAMGAS